MQRTLLIGVALGALVVMLSGCGGGGPITTTTTPAPGPTAAPTPPPPPPMKAHPFRVATYNLYWWCTSDGDGRCPQFAGDKGFQQLAARVNKFGPFDIIGMQECNDANKMASELGWTDSHEWYQGQDGQRDIGVGFSKTMFERIGDWQSKQIGEDSYGPRFFQYVRLKHKESGGTVLVGNTHGPLPWHGDCNGKNGHEVAKNFIDAVNSYIQPGDSMVVTGDFNCINKDIEIWDLNATWTLGCNDRTTRFDHIYMKNTTTSVSKCDDQSTHGVGGPSDHALTWADMAMLTPIMHASEVPRDTTHSSGRSPSFRLATSGKPSTWFPLGELVEQCEFMARRLASLWTLMDQKARNLVIVLTKSFGVTR